MATKNEVDEYLNELLAEWEEPSTLGFIVNNIMDEPIPEAVERHLLKPLRTGTVAPVDLMRKRRL